MDVVMPGLNGIEATRQIRKASPGTRVVMLSGFVDEEQITGAIRSGASGYIVKNSDVSELVLAIQTVHRGNQYFSGRPQRRLRHPRAPAPGKRRTSEDGVDTLTAREREVLQLIAEGHTNQHIADELFISVKTVEAHKAHIMDKLKAATAPTSSATPSSGHREARKRLGSRTGPDEPGSGGVGGATSCQRPRGASAKWRPESIATNRRWSRSGTSTQDGLVRPPRNSQRGGRNPHRRSVHRASRRLPLLGPLQAMAAPAPE